MQHVAFLLFSLHPERFWDKTHPSFGRPRSAHPCPIIGIPVVSRVVHTRHKSRSLQATGTGTLTATVPRGEITQKTVKSGSKYHRLTLLDSSNTVKAAEHLRQLRRGSKEPQVALRFSLKNLKMILQLPLTHFEVENIFKVPDSVLWGLPRTLAASLVTG